MRGHSHMLKDTFAVELLNASVGIEDVSAFLGHDKISTTEEYYAPWVTSRQIRLQGVMRGAWAVMLKKTPKMLSVAIQ